MFAVKLQVIFVLVIFSTYTSANRWELQGLSANSDQQGVRVEIDAFQFDEVVLNKIQYDCPEQLNLYPVHECSQATLAVEFNQNSYQAQVSSFFSATNKAWQLAFATPNKQLAITADSGSPNIEINMHELLIERFVEQFNFSSLNPLSSGLLLSGSLNFDSEHMILSAATPISFSGLSYAYSDDVIVAELSGDLSFHLDLRTLKLDYTVAFKAGEMLVNEVYADFSNFPLRSQGSVASLEGGWYEFKAAWLNEQSLSTKTRVEFNATAQWRNLSLVAEVIDAHHFNQQILSSVLGIYGFGGSQMSGQFTISAQSNDAALNQWQIQFNDFYYLNERRKLSAEALFGIINWQQNSNSKDSALNWQSLLVAGLPVQETHMDFNFSNDEFTLIGQHEFPVFDGTIAVRKWQMTDLFSESMGMSLNAEVLPISLRLITEKLGWPVMAGSISGQIPGLVKNGNVIEFLGGLELAVFNGTMQVDNLSMERLFGVAPVIAADVKFSGFDLSLLTETFGFGLITGKLDGVIDALRITNWKTDRLNAQVYTVKTKGIKQIISQRAIDNISSLGGIQGAISKTFLRFFDDFRYSKIKLSCKLHNSVCEIGGIKNQNNQFTIVEGGGIPNINIVGFVRTIDWDEFISRLLNANYEG